MIRIVGQLFLVRPKQIFSGTFLRKYAKFSFHKNIPLVSQYLQASFAFFCQFRHFPQAIFTKMRKFLFQS
jgi:hypothetical protein